MLNEIKDMEINNPWSYREGNYRVLELYYHEQFLNNSKNIFRMGKQIQNFKLTDSTSNYT